MSIAPWREEYRTGHTTIDAQHQALFALVDRIYTNATARDSDRTAVYTMLLDFEALALEHFALEEEMMRDRDYPNYTVHCTTHRNLCNKVRATLERFDSDPAAFSKEVPQVLADWMVHHIRGEDRQTIAFLRAETLQAASSVR